MDSPSTSSPSGGNSSKEKTESQKKLEQTTKDVEEVVDIMRENYEQMVARGENLTELDSRADALCNGAKDFECGARKMRRKYWWDNMKMKFIIGGVAVLLIVIIILSIVL